MELLIVQIYQTKAYVLTVRRVRCIVGADGRVSQRRRDATERSIVQMELMNKIAVS